LNSIPSSKEPRIVRILRKYVEPDLLAAIPPDILNSPTFPYNPRDDLLTCDLSGEGNISSDSDAVVSLLRRRHLANRLQIGAHLIVHLLWIGMAECVAHIQRDLA